MMFASVSTPDDRYAGQRLIPDWHQERLTRARVLVVGAGALGNEVLKNLALAGVGHVIIVDSDTIEATNLSRTVLFRDTDIGQPKAATAARALQQITPALHVTALHGDLRYILGLATVHHCSLVLGCLDNQGARSFLSRMCLAAGVPLLDAGMWATGGEVRAFLSPDDACFDCLLTPDERSDLWLRYSCTSGFRTEEAEPPRATTITTTAIVAGLLAHQAIRVLNGETVEGGSALVYNGQAGRLHQTTLNRDPACPHHTVLDWTALQRLPATAAVMTARDVLTVASDNTNSRPVLDLGRDLLLRFDCPVCATTEPIMQPQGLISETDQICPTCGTHRTAQVTSTVALDDPWVVYPLARLGVPDGDVVRVQIGTTVVLYELPSDDTG